MVEKTIWQGQSGKDYVYEIYDKNTGFKDIDGNYIFAKQYQGTWLPIYIGEGNLRYRTQDVEHLHCATSKGFTHYHVHVNNDKQLRKFEEEDLLAAFPEALEENGGCNKTKTG